MPANTRESRSKFMSVEQLWDFLGSEERIVGGHTSIPHEVHERARAHFMQSSPAESPARARAARNQDSVRKLDWQRRVPKAPAEEAAQFGSSQAIQLGKALGAPGATSTWHGAGHVCGTGACGTGACSTYIGRSF